jgi:hypothetical protein
MAAAGAKARAAGAKARAAGAKARKQAAAASTPASGAGSEHRLECRAGRPARRGRRALAITAVAMLAACGVALASVSKLGGHVGRPGAAPSRAPAQPHGPAQPRAVPALLAPIVYARWVPPAAPSPLGCGTAASLDVADVGCPGDGEDAVISSSALPPAG